MIHRFDEVEIDTRTMELRRAGEIQAVEPQVLALLLLLIENRERVLSRDELIEKIWDGRVVSDAAVSSRIKAARRVIGDDGGSQRLIRTVRGIGFRFTGSVTTGSSAIASVTEPLEHAPQGVSRPSIAILPLRVLGVPDVSLTLIADALPHELIAALSRLRWLQVIARGSSFRFRDSDPDFADIGRILNVRYCLAGQLQLQARKIAATLELVDTRDGGVIWGDRITFTEGEVGDARETLVSRLVSALDLQIPLHEARQARGLPWPALDAWSAYHLGLSHMYRFNRHDNGIAQTLFERAIRLDPGFARAHAGLSFTHFQTAFLNYGGEGDPARVLARASAEQALSLDPADPFASFNYGRSFWLEGQPEAGLPWLEQAIDLSPSYAQGIYAAGIAHTLGGRGAEGAAHVELAVRLSPLDPMAYAMTATRALASILQGDYPGASRFAERAARSPGAHVLVALIAAAAHQLNGDQAAARSWSQSALQRRPDLRIADFLQAFPFGDPLARERLASALRTLGFPA